VRSTWIVLGCRSSPDIEPRQPCRHRARSKKPCSKTQTRPRPNCTLRHCCIAQKSRHGDFAILPVGLLDYIHGISPAASPQCHTARGRLATTTLYSTPGTQLENRSAHLIAIVIVVDNGKAEQRHAETAEFSWTRAADASNDGAGWSCDVGVVG
jgi:hypothetical protein